MDKVGYTFRSIASINTGYSEARPPGVSRPSLLKTATPRRGPTSPISATM